MGYKFKITGGKSVKETGTASVSGVKYGSLGFALKNMKDASDYTVDLDTDMVGESNLTIPGKPASVTINGNGHVITLTGTKITANTNLILNDVTIKTVNKKGQADKFILTAKKNLEVRDGVAIDAKSSTVNVSKELKLSGDFNAKGRLTMPKKGYDSLTIETTGGDHTITFKGDIKLTGNTRIGDGVVLRKLNKKGKQVSGKVVKGKYTYDGPLTF